jgi:hypothetical protein
MSWGPIVVGVDLSPEAKGAAVVGSASPVSRTSPATSSTPCAMRAPLVAVSVDPQVVDMQQLQLRWRAIM